MYFMIDCSVLKPGMLENILNLGWWFKYRRNRFLLAAYSHSCNCSSTFRKKTLGNFL